MGEPATSEGCVEVPGGRVWYQITGADRPGIPVLCLHGGPGMPHDYLEPLADLASSRPVIFYDQLGCGRSDRPSDDSLWTTGRFVEELAVVRAALGLERVHLEDFLGSPTVGSTTRSAFVSVRSAPPAIRARPGPIWSWT